MNVWKFAERKLNNSTVPIRLANVILPHIIYYDLATRVHNEHSFLHEYISQGVSRACGVKCRVPCKFSYSIAQILDPNTQILVYPFEYLTPLQLSSTEFELKLPLPISK